MTTVNVHAAKTHLSRLLARVARGETIIIAKAGKPVARLVPYEEPVKRRIPGLQAGRIWIAPDFDEPLPEDLDLHAEEGTLPPPARGRPGSATASLTSSSVGACRQGGRS